MKKLKALASLISGTSKWILSFKYLRDSLWLLLVLLSASVAIQRLNHLRERNNQLIDSITEVRSEIETKRQQTKTLQKTLKEAKSKNEVLLELIKSLEERPEKVRTVVRTETVLVPQEQTPLVTETPPAEHLFQLSKGITVARFQYADSKYSFETFELEFDAQVVLTDKQSAGSVRVKSTYDDQWVDIPLTLQTDKIVSKRTFFEPQFGVGGTVSLPTGSASLALYTSFLHPVKDLDLLALRVGISKNPLLGLDIASYNFGEPLPFVQDLWLSLGGSVNTSATWSVDLTIGTKL